MRSERARRPTMESTTEPRYEIVRCIASSGLAEIRVCLEYRLNGTRLSDFPADAFRLAAVTPVYRSFEGWSDDLTRVRERRALPRQAHAYVDFIETQLEVPIKMISVGPEREQFISEPR